MNRALRLTAACLVVASLAGCASAKTASTSTLPPLFVPRGQPVRGVSLRELPTPTPTPASVVDAPNSGADNSSGFDRYPTMLWLLTSSGVLDEVGDRPVTIIAPSETAFRDFKFLDYYGVLSNPVTLAEILRRHIILGVFDAEGLIAAGTVTNLAGEQLRVWHNGGLVMVDDVTLTLPHNNQTDAATFVVYGADRLL